MGQNRVAKRQGEKEWWPKRKERRAPSIMRRGGGCKNNHLSQDLALRLSLLLWPLRRRCLAVAHLPQQSNVHFLDVQADATRARRPAR